MSESGVTAPGLPDFVTPTSALGPLTTVDAVEVSFSELGSAVAVLTVAVLFKNVPGGVATSVLTTRVKASPLVIARLAFVQLTVPFAPTIGVVHGQPAGDDSETNVVPAGSGSFNAALAAGSGPELTTVIVYVMFAPAITLSAPVLVTPMSALSTGPGNAPTATVATRAAANTRSIKERDRELKALARRRDDGGLDLLTTSP